MLITGCAECGTVITVPYPKSNSLLNSMPEPYSCINPDCGGEAVKVDNNALIEADRHKITVLSDEDYVRLLTQPKYNANPQKVGRLLLGKKMVSVDLSAAGEGNRTIVKSLTLEGGVTLHFGISSQGACVFQIEEPNAKDNSVPTEADSSYISEDRAQAGHNASNEQRGQRSEPDVRSGRSDL